MFGAAGVCQPSSLMIGLIVAIFKSNGRAEWSVSSGRRLGYDEDPFGTGLSRAIGIRGMTTVNRTASTTWRKLGLGRGVEWWVAGVATLVLVTGCGGTADP